jgi:membrane-bound lytic murein transglycosylase A
VTALAGREIAWLADPIDALMLQIQGSGRLRVTEPDGSVRMVRMAYAGTNDQPYQSVGRWLLDQGAVRDASWPGIKAWLAQNPQRTQALLWSNPRVVFFREEPLTGLDAAFGPPRPGAAR